MGLYWSPAGGSAKKEVQIRYRESGRCSWRKGLALKYHPISGTSADLADYRGSIVNLKPDTAYEVELTLAGTTTTSVLTKRTWSESFPEGTVVKVGSRSTSYSITTSGTASAYRVYDGTGATIDVKDKACVDVCPVDCIHGKDEDPQLYINPIDCIDCTLCVDACPVDAIFAEEDLPEEWTEFTKLNEDYFGVQA